MVSRNNGTIKSLFVCTEANYREVVWEQLRHTMQMKAFRLNKYENNGKVLKYFDPSALYRVTVVNRGKLKVLVKGV